MEDKEEDKVETAASASILLGVLAAAEGGEGVAEGKETAAGTKGRTGTARVKGEMRPARGSRCGLRGKRG